ncbi:isoflavone reductase homolog isoform X2 [Ipomoea triloba]|uniref:isoflavone reductase homolog isoform X2 n=1 Tax=Ipomoea triloba TaxID=35885 RepID=UPI00125D0063|nr:isoflavone reductase homolog isoform X2 [Ipomoea triloba]
MEKSKVLVVGGTGYIGKRIVKASLAQGHTTYVLHRREIGCTSDIDKLQMLLSFKEAGARLVEASFDDHRSLVDAVKQVDVVICTMSGVHFRSHNILQQLKLIEAIKEAGNIKRFVPSEFGMDPARMGNAMEAGRVTFDEKMEIRKAIEEANIPHTYISANCFAAYFCVIYMDEDDVAAYTVKCIDDPRTLNKTVYLRPQQNILTQRELIAKWENLKGIELQKITVTADEFLASMKDMDFVRQVGVIFYYHIFYEGCLTNFEIGDDGEEASQLYPEVHYTRMDEYLKRYL